MTTEAELTRRVEKIEEHCPAQVNMCRQNFEAIEAKLTKGAVKFGRHETRINHMENCMNSVKHDVGQIRATWNKTMSGIVVACILLAINAILLLFG